MDVCQYLYNSSSVKIQVGPMYARCDVLRIETCRHTIKRHCIESTGRLCKHLLCMTVQHRLACNTFGRYRELFPRGVKGQVRWGYHSPPPSAEVKSGGAISPFANTSSWHVFNYLSTGTTLLLCSPFVLNVLLVANNLHLNFTLHSAIYLCLSPVTIG
jgi:hypothetical protein